MQYIILIVLMEEECFENCSLDTFKKWSSLYFNNSVCIYILV